MANSLSEITQRKYGRHIPKLVVYKRKLDFSLKNIYFHIRKKMQDIYRF